MKTKFSFILIALMFASSAFADGVKILSMPTASSITGAETIPIVQGGVNKKATLAQLVSISASPGTVFTFAGSTCPSGSLEARGDSAHWVSRATYSALFAAIGTTYGVGDGSSTFTLPELRGEFIRGWDDSRGVDSGRTLGSNQTDQMQGHVHTQVGAAGASYSYFTGGSVPTLAQSNTGSPISDGANGTPRTGPETRPRSVALLYCIKY